MVTPTTTTLEKFVKETLNLNLPSVITTIEEYDSSLNATSQLSDEQQVEIRNLLAKRTNSGRRIERSHQLPSSDSYSELDSASGVATDEISDVDNEDLLLEAALQQIKLVQMKRAARYKVSQWTMHFLNTGEYPQGVSPIVENAVHKLAIEVGMQAKEALYIPGYSPFRVEISLDSLEFLSEEIPIEQRDIRAYLGADSVNPTRVRSLPSQ